MPPDPKAEINQPSKSKMAVYDSEIKAKLKVEENYRGSYDSVKRYVRKLNKKDPKLYARIETLAGVEAQVDFGQGAPTLKNGRYVKPRLFVMTLSHSRKDFEKVVWHQDVETFIRCHEEAFESFGGVSRMVLLDNLKSGVLKAHHIKGKIVRKPLKRGTLDIIRDYRKRRVVDVGIEPTTSRM